VIRRISSPLKQVVSALSAVNGLKIKKKNLIKKLNIH